MSLYGRIAWLLSSISMSDFLINMDLFKHYLGNNTRGHYVVCPGNKSFWDEVYELRQCLALELPNKVRQCWWVREQGLWTQGQGWPWNSGDNWALALRKLIRRERLRHQAGGRTGDWQAEAIVSHFQDKISRSLEDKIRNQTPKWRPRRGCRSQESGRSSE